MVCRCVCIMWQVGLPCMCTHLIRLCSFQKILVVSFTVLLVIKISLLVTHQSVDAAVYGGEGWGTGVKGEGRGGVGEKQRVMHDKLNTANTHTKSPHDKRGLHLSQSLTLLPRHLSAIGSPFQRSCLTSSLFLSLLRSKYLPVCLSQNSFQRVHISSTSCKAKARRKNCSRGRLL